MSRHTKSLFFTFLVFFILTQVVVLDWSPEAIFFVTWLLSALSIKHDSRISASIGLVLLAICPFLLIAGKDTVAEQTANYAFFFLAIGVLVQLEELLLERYDQLKYKLDLSYLWRPVSEAIRRRWSVAVQALGQQLEKADRTELVRFVQVIGSAGLVVVFLVSAFTGVRLAVTLPLLGGAILFPFVVWGVLIVTRALGPAWLLRVGLTLIILPLLAAEMVWIYKLISADRIARMDTAIDFIEHYKLARSTTPIPEGETIEVRMWDIGEETHRILYQHPAFIGASRLEYTVRLGNRNVLAFDVATAPESWTKEGDGVTFAVYILSEQDTDQIFSTYIDPKNKPADQRWHPHTIDLSPYAGQMVTIIFETSTGPLGDYRYDWAGWGNLRLLRP